MPPSWLEPADRLADVDVERRGVAEVVDVDALVAAVHPGGQHLSRRVPDRPDAVGDRPERLAQVVESVNPLQIIGRSVAPGSFRANHSLQAAARGVSKGETDPPVSGSGNAIS